MALQRLTGLANRDAGLAAGVVSLVSGFVLLGVVGTSLAAGWPLSSIPQRSGFAAAAFAFFACGAAVLRWGRGLPRRLPPRTGARNQNIVVVAYFLGVLLPAIRYFAGQESLGWTVASSAAVIGVSVLVGMITSRDNQTPLR